MKVVAKAMGYYGNKIRNVGEVFHLADESHLGKWMEVVEKKPEVKEVKKEKKEKKSEDLI